MKMRNITGFKRHLIPLLLAQTLTVFNDHCFKTLAVLAAMAGSQSSSQDAGFLTMILVAYVLPFILLAEPAGFFADRFSKKQVLLVTKAAEFFFLVLGSIALANTEKWGTFPLLGVMFLLALQATLFSPSFNGLLPETFREHDLSRVNGYVGMFTFMAIIGGAAGGFLLKSLLGPQLYLSGLFLAGLSALGLLCLFFAQWHKPANRERSCEWNFLAKYWRGMIFFRGRRPLLLSVLGEAYFVAFGTAVQLVLMIYGKYSLGLSGEDSLSLGMLQLAPAFGMGFGCWLAGSASRGKVELGLCIPEPPCLFPHGISRSIRSSCSSCCLSGFQAGFLCCRYGRISSRRPTRRLAAPYLPMQT